MIKVIEIENIKGISYKRFELNIVPNKPSLLVAPNGFGKSSLATAFNSMNNSKIKLNEEEDFHNEDETNIPRISINYDKQNETFIREATNTKNEISRDIDFFVINNQTRPKGIASLYGRATARLEIQDIVLVDKIPDKASFNYSHKEYQTHFGRNSKIILNIENILTNLTIVEKLSEQYRSLERGNGDRIQKKIKSIIENINAQQKTKEALLDWIEQNELNKLRQIEHVNTIGNLINEMDNNYSETICYLSAIQLIWLYNQNIPQFKKACIYSNYCLEKQRFDKTLTDFDCTWKKIRSCETHGKLVVKFPKATSISNGQRDILTFISMLFKAERHLKKNINIIIIDEVFDYLDDANLTAAQYYITLFIDNYKKIGKEIYPIILTHLNPMYFKNFAFSDQRVYYLDNSNISINVNQHIERLLKKRNDVTIKNDIDLYLFHYNPNPINKRTEFKALSLPEKWGEATNFVEHVKAEIMKYLDGKSSYDPFAVCCALRLKIEEIAYGRL
jgi:ABC-type cobalamin/Fe3+-siderophores transport system ATPase subunit